MNMSEPIRIRAKRCKGEIVTPFDVYVGRGCYRGGWNLKDSIWKNPFTVKKYGREQCLAMYEEYVRNSPHLMEQLKELKGKRLACFCELHMPCHIDRLIAIGKECKYW